MPRPPVGTLAHVRPGPLLPLPLLAQEVVVGDPGLLSVLPGTPPGVDPPPRALPRRWARLALDPLVTAVPFRWDRCSSGQSSSPSPPASESCCSFYSLVSARHRLVQQSLPSVLVGVNPTECSASRSAAGNCVHSNPVASSALMKDCRRLSVLNIYTGCVQCASVRVHHPNEAFRWHKGD